MKKYTTYSMNSLFGYLFNDFWLDFCPGLGPRVLGPKLQCTVLLGRGNTVLQRISNPDSRNY